MLWAGFNSVDVLISKKKSQLLLLVRSTFSSLWNSTENMPRAACCVASCSRTRVAERERSGHLAFLHANWVHTCELNEPTTCISKWPPNWLSLSFLVSRFSSSLASIHTWIQTYQWMWAKVEAEMDDWLAYEDRCVWVCMHVCEYVYACVPCRVKHKTAAKPCYERRRAVAATHTCTQHVFFVWLYGCMHSLTYAHEKEQHISYLRPSWGVWISGLLTVAGLSVCCSHGLFGATTGNAACT